MILANIFLWVASAIAQEVPWYTGQLVDRVQIEAPSGGLPSETPIPLLHVKEGARLDPEAVRQDVALLYQIGHFSAVEAVAIPWSTPLDNGEFQPSVLLSYRVQVAPRVVRITVQSQDSAARRLVRNYLPLQVGSVFYVEEGGDALAEDVRTMLVRSGWPEAVVSVSTQAGIMEIR